MYQKHLTWYLVDGSIVGDAKYYTLVRGKNLPPQNFPLSAEHFWLLEKTGAKVKILVFGNDQRVTMQRLKRYGNLVADVQFFLLGTDKT